MNESYIVSVLSRKLVPFILLFGCYLIVFGHISPGGGFQGGAVLASAAILARLARENERKPRPSRLTMLRITELLLFIAFLSVGAIGMVAGRAFLVNFLPDAAFVVLLNLIIGIKVGAGISVMAFVMFGGITK